MQNLSQKQIDRIEHIFDFMEYDYITDKQHDLVLSYSNQFERRRWLSELQIDALEDIFQYGNERA
jgi:hypothetical protein